MSIIYNEKIVHDSLHHVDETYRTFTLHTAHSSYQLQAGHLGYVSHLYYGDSMTDEDLSWLIKGYDRGFSGNPYEAYDERTFSLDERPSEFPALQLGDFRVPAIELDNTDGSYVFDGRYKSHRIYKGKYSLDTLPGVFATENDSVDTLELTLEDSVTHVQVVLLYSVFEEMDMITRAVKVYNTGNGTITLKRIMSTCLDFMNGNGMDVINLYGRYAQERNVDRVQIKHHIHSISSGRGSSSHQQNPFVVVCDHETTEDFGRCYGFSLVYSGNFLAEVELDQYDQLRVIMGINPKHFSWKLDPSECFEAPEVVMTYTPNGLTGMSHRYHDFYRQNLCRSKYVKEEPRPILINSWEAALFTYDDKKLIEIAKAAKDMGVELFVMDDGWFGTRDSDMSGLGDWYVNTNKIKCGLDELVRQINALGLKFGIWFEPEMCSEDSDLYRAHPDWVMQIPGRPAVRSRNQLALDMSRRDVQDYMIEAINKILDSANIDYVKWDLNRSITDIWSNQLPADKQGELYHRYVLGVYRIMDNIILTHPDILFEGCSGGGGRFDPAMLYYQAQYWVSDNNNPIDRLKLHYGTSFVYPLSCMGAHVSDSGQFIPLDSKAVMAFAGSFGYELDATHLTKEEKESCKRQTEQYHKYYDLINLGDYYRLTDPFKPGNFTAWEHVSKDKHTALVSVFVTALTNNGPQEYIRVKGLNPKFRYHMNGSKETYSGAVLMNAGIPIERNVPEYHAFQFYFHTNKKA